MQNIITLGQINDALKFATVSAAHLAELGFDALDNKPICEALPHEESRRLRNAKLYPAESLGQIRAALAKRLAAPASCLLQIQEPASAEQAAWHAGLDEGRAQMRGRIKELEAAIEDWHCKVCKTVFPPEHVAGIDFSCECGAGLLRPSSPNQRKLEAAQAVRVALSVQDAETLVRDCDYDPALVLRTMEHRFGITQEKQG